MVPNDVADYMSELLLDNATLKPAPAVSRVRERFPSIPDTVTDMKLKNKFNPLKSKAKQSTSRSRLQL